MDYLRYAAYAAYGDDFDHIRVSHCTGCSVDCVYLCSHCCSLLVQWTGWEM